MFVKIPAADMHLDSESFVSVCQVIPNYGAVESLLLSFILEPPTPGDPVYIDDVFLGAVDTQGDMESCPVYSRSYPVRRHIEMDFIRPSLKPPVEAGDGTPAITISTQLTLDRLSNLRMLVRVAGTVSQFNVLDS